MTAKERLLGKLPDLKDRDIEESELNRVLAAMKEIAELAWEACYDLHDKEKFMKQLFEEK